VPKIFNDKFFDIKKQKNLKINIILMFKDVANQSKRPKKTLKIARLLSFHLFCPLVIFVEVKFKKQFTIPSFALLIIKTYYKKCQ